MSYTIKIKDNSPKAKRCVTMLKSLKQDFDFIEIKAEKEKINSKIEKELEKRYLEFKKSKNGKDGEDLKHSFL